MNKYSHCQFIFLGDMNASFIKPQPTKRDINFMSAMEDMNFVLPNNYPLDMTYHHYNGFATSQIDYILPLRDKSFVKVLQQECTNTSTHDLVIGHIFGHFVKVKTAVCLCTLLRLRLASLRLRKNTFPTSFPVHVPSISNVHL
jgi:hypothetical protein